MNVIKTLFLLLPILLFNQSSDSKYLSFKAVPQTQSNWCWAACSAMVINNYKGKVITRDCTMAQQFFNFNCCGMPRNCNRQNSINAIRKIVRNYGVSSSLIFGKISWEAVKREIQNENPVLLRVESRYGGHFIVINGFYTHRNTRTGEVVRMLDIYDPAYGYLDPNTRGIDGRRVRWNDLVNGRFIEYRFKWTHTVTFSG